MILAGSFQPESVLRTWMMSDGSCCVRYRLVLDLLQCSQAPQDFFHSFCQLRGKNKARSRIMLMQRLPEWKKWNHFSYVWTAGTTTATPLGNESLVYSGLMGWRKPPCGADRWIPELWTHQASPLPPVQSLRKTTSLRKSLISAALSWHRGEYLQLPVVMDKLILVTEQEHDSLCRLHG